MSADNASQGVSKCYVFKSQLQEYAQKVGFTTPVYGTIKEGPSHEPTFRSTVTVNEIKYESLPGFLNRKTAEQSAAEVALAALAKSGEMTLHISQPVHETGLCKNLLQEYAQKMNYAIPLYEIVKANVPGRVPHFSCTATIGEIKYTGAIARTKKEAEISAARTALLAIQSSGSDLQATKESVYTVVPSKRKVNDSAPVAPNTVPALKPKKRRFRKKPRKKMQPGVERNRTLIEFQSAVTVENDIPSLSAGTLDDKISSVVANEGGKVVSEGAQILDQPRAESNPCFSQSVAAEMHSIVGNGQLATVVNHQSFRDEINLMFDKE